MRDRTGVQRKLQVGLVEEIFALLRVVIGGDRDGGDGGIDRARETFW